MMTVGYINQLKKCPPPKVIYKYIPRTFKQEQDNPVKTSQIFSTMFEEPTPWAGAVGMVKKKSNGNINRYFISQ